LSIVTYLQDAKIDGAIIVTTPQEVAWLSEAFSGGYG
jgi:Mrp family chromosome partitioning ATPase